MKLKKIAIAMSGGVDSAVAAALLAKQGYQVTGVHLSLWCEGGKDNLRENKCCSTESLEAARRTAFQLGIPFHVFDFSELFKKGVVDYFLKEYGLGNTPNPCVVCNKLIKFGALLDYVRAMGFEYLATGHYCRIVAELRSSNKESRIRKNPNSKFDIRDSNLVYHLLSGADQVKDQSYFLYNLKQEQLAHLLFPLGELTKPEVRKLAEKLKLPVANRPESQEICFFAENDYQPFLKRNIANKVKPGRVVDSSGNIIGSHDGLPLYTIGQRHGFTLNIKNQNSKLNNSDQKLKIIPPYYVISKEVKHNRLVVGFGKETEVSQFSIREVSWVVGPDRKLNSGLFVKIRHQGELLKCRLEGNKVILAEPRRGVSPGQSAVFYSKIKNQKSKIISEDWEVLGGGIII
jgi:tRNA-uridine 2-sulfurtransferase